MLLALNEDPKKCSLYPMQSLSYTQAKSQLAFYLNLYQTIVGPTGILLGQQGSNIDLIRMLAGMLMLGYGHLPTQTIIHQIIYPPLLM